MEPVTMAVSPEPSIPCVTSSAVEEDENPDGPFLLKSHIFVLWICFCLYKYGDDDANKLLVVIALVSQSMVLLLLL